jgi:hypothetical protein
MLALTAAFLTAAIALVGKVIFDSWGRYRDRQGVASALAGETQAYIVFLKRRMLLESLHILIAASREDRLSGLRVFGQLPASHPVFDRVADRIGLLSVETAFELSKLYNSVSRLRLIMSELSSDRFIALLDDQQIEIIEQLVVGIEEHIMPAQSLVDHLKATAAQSFREYFFSAAPELLSRGRSPPLEAYV